MIETILNLLPVAGGLGLFLLGMVIMTEGLRKLAGKALQAALCRFTHSPTTGAATGAVVTAAIQSSTATTVTAIGFVGSGLLTFAQALGIILGANIGTTITGWLVALIGFKFKLGLFVMPLVLVGILLHLFRRDRLRALGYALAGFGVLFLGIGFLQQGMKGFEGVLSLSDFPVDSFGGRLKLVLLGILITLITQSSSAGVAMALAALSVGTISLPQAAAMVIGMDIGTTFTAIIASLGGSTRVKQTAFAHVIYNLMTGVMALFLLSPYLAAMNQIMDVSNSDPELFLVGFHTFFNGLGVLFVLPFAKHFATFIEQLIPEKGNILTRRLDGSLLDDPALAIAAVGKTLREISSWSFTVIEQIFDGRVGDSLQEGLRLLEASLLEVRQYLAMIQTSSALGRTYLRHQSAMHAVDHLHRMAMRLKRIDRVETLQKTPELQNMARELRQATRTARQALHTRDVQLPVQQVQTAYEQLVQAIPGYRMQAIQAAVLNTIEDEQVLRRLDALRWLARIAHHTWRTVHHLSRIIQTEELAPDVMPVAFEHDEPD